jgi:hypothetical protein
MDDMELLITDGECIETIAARIGVAPRSITTALGRHRPDLLTKVNRLVMLSRPDQPREW